MFRFIQFVMVSCLMVAFAGGCASVDVKEKEVISETLKPTGIHEDCVELSPGQSIEYSFDSSKPLNFNIHYHEDSGIFYPLQRDNTLHEGGRFQAEKRQHYCLMWTNAQSEAVRLTYRMKVEKK